MARLPFSDDGQLLSDQQDARNKELIKSAEAIVLAIVAIAAQQHQPFAADGKNSPEDLSLDHLAPVFRGAFAASHIKAAKENLIRMEQIYEIRGTARGGAILDIPGGPFAEPDAHLDDSGKPPKFKPGAPEILSLRAEIEERAKRYDSDNGRGAN